MNQLEINADPVLSRRSIRKFKSKPIKSESVKLLLQAAMAAPSAEDERPWQFVIVNDKDIIASIPSIHPDTHIMRNAPLLILVCGNLARQKAHEFWIQDCSAATENILIESRILNMGSVWLGIYPIKGRVDGFREYFLIPENIIPFSIIAVGHPDEYKEPLGRYDESRIHYQKW